MKMTKRILSFLLCALMICSPLMGLDVDWSIFDIKANALTDGGDITITQTRVVSDYVTKYAEYADRFFGEENGGNEANGPTNFVIPGLSSTENYVPQGMTYWKEKEWILISAYDAAEETNSVIYAIDAASTEFVALFKIFNKNGSANKSHGGGIAASEHNFYYADSGSNISYWPIEEMDVADGTVKNITIYDSINCSGELNGAYTSYCCYDDGVLWAGNFYYSSTDYDYYRKANDTYNSMLIGYKLAGSNSAEEWAYLNGRYNKQITITKDSGTDSKNDANFTWKAYHVNNLVNITGSITAPTAYVGEFAPSFGSFQLEEGKDYTIEFTSTNRSTDLYMFSPAGTHCNVKQSSQTTITDNGDGTYNYSMYFTAGLKPVNADSTWPTTQSTDGTYTGTYTVRFDQDAIQAGEARDFTISNILISEVNVNMMYAKPDLLGNQQTHNTTTYTVTQNDDESFKLTGTKTDSTKYAYTNKFADFALVEGEKYTVSFISDNAYTNIYMFAPNGTHHSFFSTYTKKLADGRYYYEADFTAGIKNNLGPTDITWPEKQSTDGTYTGLYTLRFDINNNVEITDYTVDEIKIKKSDNSRITDTHIGIVGNPTYCIAIDNTIDKVQYAMVDKGKIYISRSWGRGGTNNDLIIGDIDINSPGTESLTINGSTRLCHKITTSDVTYFSDDDMLLMGEALCIMNDNLYMFGEGAAYKYQNGDGNGTCAEPIDVIWKIDQYKIMGEKRPIEDVKASHYEKVTDLSQLSTEATDDEYLIVFESPEKDPVTQKNILYALDSFGGYGDNKLPKQNTLTAAATGDSMGIIGYEISDYSTSGDILYVSEEVDSQKSLRWNIQNIGGTGALQIKNSDLYYSSNPYLAMGSRVFAMSSTAQTINAFSAPAVGAGGTPDDFLFYTTVTSGDDAKNNYLWCNFESAVSASNNSFMESYSDYYKNNNGTNYAGLDEIPGTFHTDAIGEVDDIGLESGNILNESIADYSYGHINLYKRIQDEYSSTYQSRVFTDMNAELQSDGTYKIDIESYALSNIQYQTVDERPTDFIFVLDTSASMWNEDNADCTGYKRWTGDLSTASIAGDTEACDKEKANGSTVWCSNQIYYQHTDGTFCVVKCCTKDDGSYVGGRYTRVKVWYTHNDINYYMMSDGNITTTEPSWDSCVRVKATSVPNRAGKTVYTGEHYSAETVTRLQAMQNAVNQLTYKIADEAARTGLDHRISVIQYGSSDYQEDNWINTGMYATTGGTSMYQYNATDSSLHTITSDVYKNAFFTTDQFATVRSIINNINTSVGDADTFVNYGMDMAANVVKNSGNNYYADGDRSACVIMITDGVPGLGSSYPDVANIVANDAINKAHIIKESGAYIYSVQMGSNSIDGFNMDRYMDYISSEFIDATSMTDSGDRNIKDVEYRIDVPTGSDFDLVELVSAMFDSVTSNSTNAMVKLDKNSILRQELTDAFDISNATVTVSTADAKVDGLGRFVFGDPVENTSAYTYSKDSGTNTVTVKGFDYSDNYVSTEGGKKLVVTLTGVLANEDAELVNTSINNTDTTAIYQTEALMNAGEAFKHFPTENFTIPEYTYVLDFDKPMLDTDINGTLLSVSPDLSKQETYKTAYDSSNIGLDFTNNNQDMIYSLNSSSAVSENANKAYCLIERDDGTYDWFRINIVPASNILYEENKFAVTNTTGIAWSTTGTAKNNYQALSTTTDVYGYDEIYYNTDTYSNGSALTTTVNSTNKRSQIVSFDFSGTGFELYGACGPTTGIQIVTVKNRDTGKVVNAVVVDTYYNDTYGTLTQVPIVSINDLEYGNYTVQVAASYLSFAGALGGATTQSVAGFDDMMAYSAPVSGAQMLYEMLAEIEMDYVFDADELDVVWFDEDSIFNGGYGANTLASETATTSNTATDIDLVNIVDSIRIYNPALGDTIYSGDDYYISSEKGAQYYNIMDNLVNGGIVSGSGIFSYVAGNDNFDIENGDYDAIGSKDELYLSSKTSAVTFSVADAGINDQSRVMISLRAASGTPTVKIGNAHSVIPSNTEMYYDITDYVADDGTVTIQNITDGTLLAVGSVKITGTVAMMSTFNLMTARRMMMADSEAVELNDSTNDIIAPVDTSLLPTPEVDTTPDTDTSTDSDASTDKNSTENQIIAFFNKVADFFKKLIETIMSLFGY